MNDRLRYMLGLLLTVAMIVMAVLPVAAAPAAPESTGQLTVTPLNAFGAQETLGKGQRWPYIIRLAGEPLATYKGGVQGLSATSPAVTGQARLDVNGEASKAYASYLAQQQAEFIAQLQQVAKSAQVIYTYQVTFNGVAAVMTAENAKRVASLPGVVSVVADELLQPLTDVTPDFIGATAVWDGSAAGVDVGTQAEGVIVGVIDTGIWPEHPSFEDDGTFPEPPEGWGGECTPPADDTPGYTCNNKLIGIQYFLDGYDAAGGYDGLFFSGRDDDGHGTHTSSTAAGNADVPVTLLGVDRGTISGMAPRAHVASYKTCGPGGCFGSDLVAAIDKATADGVDVINYSIGGGASNPWADADSLAFLAAREAGVFAATSAGNAGPGPGTVGSPANAPWITTVGASTSNRHFISEITLSGPGEPPMDLFGASLTAGVTDFNLVDAEGIPDSTGDASGLCLNPYLPGTFEATDVVLCRRGIIARVARGNYVEAGGGGGVILYNPTRQGLATDNYVIPAVHVENDVGQAIKDYIVAHPGEVTVSFTPGTATFGPADPRVIPDMMASFSSRGPNEPAPAIIKPDVTAPGVQILAGASPEHTGDGAQGELFQSIQGTSMSSPHTAGAGALLKAVHPDWSPAAIQSALMTTALTEVVKEDGATAADPFDMGAGRIDLNQAADPGLVFDMTGADYMAGEADPVNMNLPSIGLYRIAGRATVTRMATSMVGAETTWTVSYDAPDGVTISVSPDPLVVPANGTATFEITVDAVNAAAGPHFAHLYLSHGPHMVHMPVAFTNVPAVWSSLSLQTQYDADMAPFTLLSGADIDDFVVGSYGLVDPLYIPGGPLEQDPDQDPNTDTYGAGFETFELTATGDSLWWVIQTRNFQGADLDLFLLYDANGNGEFEWGVEEIDRDTSGDADEEVEAVLPAPGDYLVAVHAWGGSGTYDLKVYDVTVNSASGQSFNIMDAPESISAGNEYEMTAAWDYMIAEGEEYLGLVTMGSSTDPLAVGFEPVRIMGIMPAIQKMVDREEAPIGGSANYELTLANVSDQERMVELEDVIPDNMAVHPDSITGGAMLADGNVVWSGTLPAAANTIEIGPSDFPYGYLPLADFVPPISGVCEACDEAAANFAADPPVSYLGESYDTVCMVSNGYLVLGGCASGADISFIPQNFPDGEAPNNVIAPFWMDLDLDGGDEVGGGTWYAAALTDGVDDWLVYEWEDAERWNEDGTAFTFQVWLQQNAEAVTFAYGRLDGPLDGSVVGAENMDATAGAVRYYNDGAGMEVGTPPGLADLLDVSGQSGPSLHTITYAAMAQGEGEAMNVATLMSEMARDSASATVMVTGSPIQGEIMQSGDTDPVVHGSTVDVDVSVSNMGDAAIDGFFVMPLDSEVAYVMGSAYGGAMPLTAARAAQLAEEYGVEELTLLAGLHSPDDVVAVAFMGMVAGGETVEFGFGARVTSYTGMIQHSAALFDGSHFLGSLASGTIEIVDIRDYDVERSRRFDVLEDAFIHGLRPTTNFGASETMWVGFVDMMRPAVYTPISDIPTDAAIDVAYLYLFVVEGRGFSDWSSSVINVYAHALMTDWSESAVTWWTPWAMAGGDFGETVGTNHLGSGKVGTWLRLDVTDAVEHSVRSGENYGFLLTSDDENGVRYGLATTEHWNSAWQGYLRVMYRTAE